MPGVNLLLKKLRIECIEFITAKELKTYCTPLNLDYTATVRYLLDETHLTRIFRGIFHVKSVEEEKLGKIRYTPYELVTKGLELKGVTNWYFGLNTALKLNNMTHEHHTVDTIINDTLFRRNPITIAGYKYRFVKLTPKLLGFGVITDGIRYSDPEKTLLDLIYTWRYNGVTREKIILNTKEYTNTLSKDKLRSYAKNYPKTVQKMMEAMP